MNQFKVTLFFSGIFLIFGCTDSSDANPEDVLPGTWHVAKVNGNKVDLKEGITFSPNKQFFYIDSQGKSIPKLMEKIWNVSQDTLRLIDYNWEQKFLYEKGTKIFVIEALSSNELKLKMIHPHEDQKITYEKE